MNKPYAGASWWAAVALGMISLGAQAGEQVVRIGLTGPLTGPQAAIGKDDENGVRMAIERLNAEGLVIGGQKTRFELVSQDDAADPRTGMTVAQSLVDANVKVIFGPFNSGVAIPISNLVNVSGIVMATVASNPRSRSTAIRSCFESPPAIRSLAAGWGNLRQRS